MAREDPSERRIVPITIKLRCDSHEELKEQHGGDLSRGFFFVRTRTPKPADTLLQFTLQLSHGETVLRGIGRVAMVIHPDQSKDRPGMMLQLRALDATSQLVMKALGWDLRLPTTRVKAVSIPVTHEDRTQPRATNPLARMPQKPGRKPPPPEDDEDPYARDDRTQIDPDARDRSTAPGRGEQGPRDKRTMPGRKAPRPPPPPEDADDDEAEPMDALPPPPPDDPDSIDEALKGLDGEGNPIVDIDAEPVPDEEPEAEPDDQEAEPEPEPEPPPVEEVSNRTIVVMNPLEVLSKFQAPPKGVHSTEREFSPDDFGDSAPAAAPEVDPPEEAESAPAVEAQQPAEPSPDQAQGGADDARYPTLFMEEMPEFQGTRSAPADDDSDWRERERTRIIKSEEAEAEASAAEASAAEASAAEEQAAEEQPVHSAEEQTAAPENVVAIPEAETDAEPVLDPEPLEPEPEAEPEQTAALEPVAAPAARNFTMEFPREKEEEETLAPAEIELIPLPDEAEGTPGPIESGPPIEHTADPIVDPPAPLPLAAELPSEQAVAPMPLPVPPPLPVGELPDLPPLPAPERPSISRRKSKTIPPDLRAEAAKGASIPPGRRKSIPPTMQTEALKGASIPPGRRKSIPPTMRTEALKGATIPPAAAQPPNPPSIPAAPPSPPSIPAGPRSIPAGPVSFAPQSTIPPTMRTDALKGASIPPRKSPTLPPQKSPTLPPIVRDRSIPPKATEPPILVPFLVEPQKTTTAPPPVRSEAPPDDKLVSLDEAREKKKAEAEAKAEAPPGAVSIGRLAAKSKAPKEPRIETVEIPTPASSIVAIDFGATNTMAARFRAGSPELIPSPEGDFSLPSLFAIEKKGLEAVGREARGEQLERPKNAIYAPARLLGRPYDSPSVRELLKKFPYSIAESPDGETQVETGGKRMSLREASSKVIGEALNWARKQSRSEITRAVLTVPGSLTANQRRAVRESAELAGITVERLISKSTASAIFYGYERNPMQKIIVFRLGGGSFDVSVIAVMGGRSYQVLATRGDTVLGGVDFDLRVQEILLAQLEKEHNQSFGLNPIIMQKLLEESEQAKISLSDREVYNVGIPYLPLSAKELVDFDMTLNRSDLERVTIDLVDRVMDITEDLLADLRLKPSEVGDYIVVGGMSRMPAIRNRLRSLFGKEPVRGIHPEEAPVLGAAIFADLLGKQGDQALTVMESQATSIGLSLPGGKFKKILESGTGLPASVAYGIPTTTDGQTEVDLFVFEGESDRALDNHFLGFAKLPVSRGTKGTVKAELTFNATPDGLLTVARKDGVPVPLSLKIPADELKKKVGNGPAPTAKPRRPGTRARRA